MTFHLEPITSVSPDLPAPSYGVRQNVRKRADEWPVCSCGERQEFVPDEIGYLIPRCPVCDFGRARRCDYTTFLQKRKAAEAARLAAERSATMPPPVQQLRCAQCQQMFDQPRRGGQVKYCGKRCSRRAVAARLRLRREKMAQSRRCVICEKPNYREGRSCSVCADRVRKLARAKKDARLRAYWQNKQLRGAA